MQPFKNFAEMKSSLGKQEARNADSPHTMREVPLQKLEELEQARLRLYELANLWGFDTYKIMQLQEVSAIMWEIANRKKF